MEILICLIIIFACVLSIVYIWCIKPKKSLKDGLKDWIDESKDDI